MSWSAQNLENEFQMEMTSFSLEHKLRLTVNSSQLKTFAAKLPNNQLLQPRPEVERVVVETCLRAFKISLRPYEPLLQTTRNLRQLVC